MVHHDTAAVRTLTDKGVTVLAPETVYIAPDVDVDRISADGVVIHPGCRILGKHTLISAGCQLGAEAPMTIENCALGHNVRLKGGYARDSVFLDGAEVGSGAQIREGCLFEEQSSAAHSVGCKQTILFPYATLGSLINFCDCLLAGGTARSDHSEVGSGYIHFNFTPAGHKATASLFGEVTRGVWLREPPVFLGGGGGAVGPVQVGYGAVVGAGSILRDDVPDETQVVSPPRASNREVDRFGYPRLASLVQHNVTYIAHLIALRAWYHQVRRVFFTTTEYGNELVDAALAILDGAIIERAKRLQGLVNTVPTGDPANDELRERMSEIAIYLASRELRLDRTLIERITASKQPYLSAISALPDDVVQAGRHALTAFVTEITTGVCTMLPRLFPQ